MAKSVILVEDLDQFMEPESGATTTVTALGIQSFMDGIISACCREERVMVFTMNNKECVNPNLLQPSRVAVHIHFSVCDFSTIKTLVYLATSNRARLAQSQITDFHYELSPRKNGAAEEKEASTSTTSIIFNTVGRAHYAFDIYSLPIQQPPTPDRELRLTDGHFVNFNGHFLSNFPPHTPLLSNSFTSPREMTSFILPPPQGEKDRFWNPLPQTESKSLSSATLLVLVKFPSKASPISPQLLLESVKSLVPGLSLFRFVGEFPAFSPSGDRFAYNDMP
ncbi:hypothetical protein JHK82_015022 [Glycine max]|nr:hypothetical protein JHK85_015394 [Glycine max]KAG5045635.1 hypothetical protein JHK86_015041 [Glycine max]KAG5148141.1 hypothetical protein JHK82_015022 [Glycine max]